MTRIACCTSTAASCLLRQAEKDVVTKGLPGTKEKDTTEDSNV
jgi:hypothetical protein